MKKKLTKKYKIELSKEELETLRKARDIIDEIEDFATDNDIDELEGCITVNDYLMVLDPPKALSSDGSSAWDCPAFYTDEQRRCFYGDFG